MFSLSGLTVNYVKKKHARTNASFIAGDCHIGRNFYTPADRCFASIDTSLKIITLVN